MIFHELFQVGACPNLKDSLLFDRISILMYKARIIRYLQQLSSICDSFMPCTVHVFVKKMIFHEIFQVGACPNLKDSSLYERYSIHVYKARKNLYLQQFSPFCESIIPCAVHFFGKKMVFHEIFQVGACPNLKDSFLYDRFSIHMYKARSIRYLQQFSSICDSHALYGTFFSEKEDFS